MRRRLHSQMLLGVIPIAFLSLCATLCAQERSFEGGGKDSIVPREQQLGDFEIDLARARALSQTRSSVAEAVPIYRNLLASRPDAGEVAVELAGILMRLARFRDAVAVLERLRGPIADKVETRLLLGKCYLWSEQAPAALEVLTDILSSHPSNADVLLFAARAATASGGHVKAVELAERFARVVGPTTSRARFELAQARFGAADIQGALTHYRELFNSGGVGSAVLTEAEWTDARRNYGLTLSWSGNAREALPILRDYSAAHPEDSTVELELMRAYAQRGDAGSTLSMMKTIRSREDLSVQTQLDLADVYAAIGHLHEVRSIVGAVERNDEFKRRFRVRLAELKAYWGAFSEASKTLLEQIDEGSDDSSALVRLGASLVSDEQPFRARSVYMSLLRSDSEDVRVHCGMASLELSVGNTLAAQKHLQAINSGKNVSRECRFEAARLWGALGGFDEAHAVLDPGMESMAPEEHRKYLRLKASLARLAKQNDNAITWYREILNSFPDDAEGAYWLRRLGGDKDPLGVLLRDPNGFAPQSLLELANSLIAQEEPQQALRVVEHLVQSYKEFIPGMMLRAELRGVDGQYSASIKDYDELLSQLPDSSKLRLGRARVLAFARDYDAALQELETLHTADPGNFEVLREAARFAFWGRRYSESLGYYDRLIAGVEKKPADQGMSELLTVVRLERQAKDGVLNGGADSAEKALVQLLELEPGNKEALFDLAQIHCARGRVSASVECYDRITTLAPLHRMAPKARAQILRRQNPTLHTGGYYRSEEGRGELARISKRHYFAATSLRSGEDWKFGLQANVWGEQPHLRRESFESFGPGFEAQRRIGRSSYGRAWINSRFYTEGSLGSRATGGVDGRFALDDWNELTAGYERIDEIFNRFGLEEELQSDNLWLNLKSAVQRDTEVTSELRVLRYTDSNTGMHGFVEIHHALTEFPGRFRLGGRGEFRHTDERNVFFSDQSGVVSIEHPYWTPQEYGAGFVFLDWHHELNDILFCEQNRHYYKVRFAPFSATDGNAGIDVTAEWSLELEDGLGFGIQLSTQQSRLYDAEQLSGVVRYNF